MRVDFKGLKFRNRLYLMIFSVMILAVLWVLQFLFLDTFYLSMKTNEIIKIGEKVTAEYKESGDPETIIEYALRNNLRIELLDSGGRSSGWSDGFGGFIRPGVGGRMLSFKLDEIEIKFEESGGNAIHYTNSDEMGGMSQIVYVAKITSTSGELQYIYISNPLPPIDSTVTVLRTQFIVITIIVLALSIIAAGIMSKTMSRPIINLTKSAEGLARGNLSVHFEGEGYTEIYQLSETLNYATQELTKLDIYRKEFMANVSHDLKTPLTIIKMYAEMIRDIAGEDPEKREAHCGMIVKEADWLTGMVNEILELSKLEAGGAEFEVSGLDASACLRETLSSFNVLAERDGYIFEFDIENNIIIKANEQYLRRIFYNMISNSVNYTGDDKRVWVTFKDLGGCVRFEVRDTGAGIPQDKLESIWERYYKSEQAHKRAVIGTGLGLAITKQLLDLHGARYGVVSRENEGSLFWFEMVK